MDKAYLASQRVLSAFMCVIGIAMAVSTVVRGGGPLSLGVILGVLFAGLGAARLWIARVHGARSKQ